MDPHGEVVVSRTVVGVLDLATAVARPKHLVSALADVVLDLHRVGYGEEQPARANRQRRGTARRTHADWRDILPPEPLLHLGRGRRRRAVRPARREPFQPTAGAAGVGAGTPRAHPRWPPRSPRP